MVKCAISRGMMLCFMRIMTVSAYHTMHLTIVFIASDTTGHEEAYLVS